MSNFLYDITGSSRGFEVMEEKFSPLSSWKSLKIKGVFQRADARNQNGRIYPRAVLTKAIQECSEALSNHSMFGELDHPADQTPTVSLRNVSHVVTSLRFSGNDVIGEAIVFDDPGPSGTPQGRVLGSLIRNNCTVGVSSRGLGAVSKSGIGNESVVQEYKLVTFDSVHDPSTQNAYLQAVNESRNRSMKDIEDEVAFYTSFKTIIQDAILHKYGK